MFARLRPCYRNILSSLHSVVLGCENPQYSPHGKRAVPTGRGWVGEMLRFRFSLACGLAWEEARVGAPGLGG
jgi:hypothetical protein